MLSIIFTGLFGFLELSGLIYEYGLSWIPAWIINHMTNNVGEITSQTSMAALLRTGNSYVISSHIS